jgi:hypothetical protein
MKKIKALWKTFRELIIMTAVVGTLVVGCALLQSKFESEAYNRLTGAKTTMWDALVLELRVQEGTK